MVKYTKQGLLANYLQLKGRTIPLDKITIMIKNLFSFIAIIALVASCATSKNNSTDPSESIKNTPSSGKTELAEKPVELSQGNLFATIKRGYCYGTCPVYNLTIYANGVATYNAIRNNEL